MTWGLELWDQEKEIVKTSENGINLIGKCRDFMQARAQIEMSYAKELRKLIKSSLADCSKPDVSDQSTTLLKAWQLVLQETDDMAKQHELISEGIMANSHEPLKTLYGERKEAKKTFQADLSKLQKALALQRSKYESARKAYEKAHAATQDAHAKHAKAEQENNVVKVQKEKENVTKCEDAEESAKTEYLLATDQFNRHQAKFYNEEQASLYDEWERTEQQRIQQQTSHLVAYGKAIKSVFPILNTCLENLTTVDTKVNPQADTDCVISAFKTGFPIPADEVVVDMRAPAQTTSLTVQKINEKRVTKSKFFKTTSRKKDAVREDFGHLPPEQRKKALHKKVAELTQEQATLTKTKLGLEKTIEIYAANPQMGDAKALAAARKELITIEEKTKKAAEMLYKFQMYLSVFEGTPAPAPPEGYALDASALGDEAESYMGDEFGSEVEDEFAEDGDGYGDVSLSPHPSSSSMASGKAANPFATSASPAAHNPFAASTPKAPPPPPKAKVLWTAKALYAFPGSNPGELPIEEGDDLAILEDDGSGWVKAAKDSREGYVPKSYVQDATA